MLPTSGGWRGEISGGREKEEGKLSKAAEERRRRRWGCVEVASFPNIGTCFLPPPIQHPTPTSTTSPRFYQACICCPVFFPFAKDGNQRASIVYCSSVMVWKQPSAEAFDICGHINQGCHTACLPSLAPHTPPDPVPTPHLNPCCPRPVS
ncbi:hypothetical protein PAMP_014427 [Pampus punctatissimus]